MGPSMRLRSSLRARWTSLVLAGGVLAAALPATASEELPPDEATPASEDPPETEEPPIAPGVEPRVTGRPNVRLDRLEFPKDLPGAAALERYFKRELARAAKRADWGAGRGAKIEYRVKIEELRLGYGEGVLRVHCTAFGRLPRGKSARSHISFGGDPRKRDHVVRHVLAIVARGVVTRLAALERARRKASARPTDTGF